MPIIQDLIDKQLFHLQNFPFKRHNHNHNTDFFEIDFLNMGFLTFSCSIGGFHNTTIYKNHYEYMMQTISSDSTDSDDVNYDVILNSDVYKVESRSEINGFMKKEKAVLLYDMLKSNSDYVVMFSSMQTDDLPLEFQHSEFTFKAHAPMYAEYKENKTIIEENNIECFNGDEIFKKLHHICTRHFAHCGDTNRLQYVLQMFNDNLIYTDIDEYVEFSIMDKKWGHRLEIFKDMKKSLKKINNI